MESTYRAQTLLELIHGDLCELIALVTLEGKMCVFVLRDDCTRYIWITLIKSNEEVLAAFKSVKKDSDGDKIQAESFKN